MKIAIIDGNNLSFKIFSAMKESRGGLLKSTMGVPTTVIFGMLRTLNFLAMKTSFDKVVICWDVSGSYYRKKLFKLYKAHRKYVDMKDYFEELDSARMYLRKLGINQAIAKGIEADDVIGFLSHKFVDMGHSAVIVSDDKDFFQVTKHCVKIYRPVKDEFINESEVFEQFGMKPHLLPRIKAITGEDTDFIPGCCDINEKDKKLIKCGLGEKTAMKLLAGKKDLKDAIENCELEKWKDKLKEKRKQIFLSYKLAKIRTKVDKYQDWERPLLYMAIEDAFEERKIKVRKVSRLINMLEIKAMNVPFILKRLGVKLDVEINEKETEALRIKI
jgi:DNA polymerase-1